MSLNKKQSAEKISENASSQNDLEKYNEQIENNNNNDIDSNNEQTNEQSLNQQNNQNFKENANSLQQPGTSEGYNEVEFQNEFPEFVNELISENIDRIQKQKSQTFDDNQKSNPEKEHISQQNIQEQQEMQPTSAQIKKRQSTEFQASLNLIKSFIGAGIMGLPYAFMKAGYILSIIILILFNAVIYYSTCLVIDIGEDLRKDKFTFIDIFDISLGKKAVTCFKLFLFFFQIGIGIAYVIFFTKFFEIVFWHATDAPIHRLLCLLMSSLIIVPMILINTYHFFYKWSRIGNICALVGILGMFGYACSQLEGKQAEENGKDVWNILQLPSLTGIVVSSFECVGHIQPIRNSMQKPEKFRKIFKLGAIVVSCVYIVFSTFCVVAIGNKLNQIVIMGIEKKYRNFTIIQAFYAVSLIFTYPLQLYPIYEIVRSNKYVKKWQEKDSKSKFRHYFPRFVITGVIFLIAYFVPKFSSFLNLLGASCGSSYHFFSINFQQTITLIIAIQFILPILAYEVYYKTTITTKKKWFNRFILVLGIIGGIFAIVKSIKELSE